MGRIYAKLITNVREKTEPEKMLNWTWYDQEVLEAGVKVIVQCGLFLCNIVEWIGAVW